VSEINSNMNVDDVFLTIINNQSHYRNLLTFVKKVIEKRYDYREYRAHVLYVLRTAAGGGHADWGARQQIQTSQLCEMFFLHYYEEAAGKPRTARVVDHFRAFCPGWAAGQARGDRTNFNRDQESTCTYYQESSAVSVAESIEQYLNPKDNPVKEQDMSTANSVVAIETKTFVYGQEASTLTDDQIFGYIAKIEKEIDDLDKIKRKPKKLQAKIDQMKSDIDKLTEFVDNRE